MPAFDYVPMPLTQYSAFSGGLIPRDVFGVAINLYINRTPLLARLPKLPVGSPEFVVVGDGFRPRLTQLSVTTDNSQTTITPIDATMFENGDVIKIETEIMLVSGRTANGTTITVVRGYDGTSAAAHTAGTAPNQLEIHLITNTRTGAEVDQDGIARIADTYTQYLQTIQHPYQVGGALQANSNYIAGTGSSPLDRFRTLAIQHTSDDAESAMLYGTGVAMTGPTSKPQMLGIRNIVPGSNFTSAPTNASAYKSSDFMRDTISKVTQGGGNPTLILVSTDFQAGFSTWANPLVRVTAGANVFGTAINLFEAPFISGAYVVPAPMLKPGTAVALSADEARIRVKRSMMDKPRGSRGDAFEGDVIAELAIELDNPSHHAWVEGVTGFAKD